MHDQVAHDANKLRLKEAEVLTRMAPKRLQKKRQRDDEDDDSV